MTQNPEQVAVNHLFFISLLPIEVQTRRENLIRSGDSGSFEYEPCLARNRLIHHLAIHGTHALSVYKKYLACLGHLLFSRGQDFIDDRDLCRMDCAFAMKAETPRGFCLPFETVHISNVEIGRIENGTLVTAAA